MINLDTFKNGTIFSIDENGVILIDGEPAERDSIEYCRETLKDENNLTISEMVYRPRYLGNEVYTEFLYEYEVINNKKKLVKVYTVGQGGTWPDTPFYEFQKTEDCKAIQTFEYDDKGRPTKHTVYGTVVFEKYYNDEENTITTITYNGSKSISALTAYYDTLNDGGIVRQEIEKVFFEDESSFISSLDGFPHGEPKVPRKWRLSFVRTILYNYTTVIDDELKRFVSFKNVFEQHTDGDKYQMTYAKNPNHSNKLNLISEYTSEERYIDPIGPNTNPVINTISKNLLYTKSGELIGTTLSTTGQVNEVKELVKGVETGVSHLNDTWCHLTRQVSYDMSYETQHLYTYTKDNLYSINVTVNPGRHFDESAKEVVLSINVFLRAKLSADEFINMIDMIEGLKYFDFDPENILIESKNVWISQVSIYYDDNMLVFTPGFAQCEYSAINFATEDIEFSASQYKVFYKGKGEHGDINFVFDNPLYLGKVCFHRIRSVAKDYIISEVFLKKDMDIDQALLSWDSLTNWLHRRTLGRSIPTKEEENGSNLQEEGQA